MKKSRLATLLLGLSLVILVILPACSSGTSPSTTPAPTSTPAKPTTSGPLILQSIDASPTGIDIRIKSTGKIDVTANYTNGAKQDVTAKCTYASSDEKIATVSTSGQITTQLIDGTCTVTISYTENGVTKTDTVEVKAHTQFLGSG